MRCIIYLHYFYILVHGIIYLDSESAPPKENLFRTFALLDLVSSFILSASILLSFLAPSSFLASFLLSLEKKALSLADVVLSCSLVSLAASSGSRLFWYSSFVLKLTKQKKCYFYRWKEILSQSTMHSVVTDITHVANNTFNDVYYIYIYINILWICSWDCISRVAAGGLAQYVLIYYVHLI